MSGGRVERPGIVFIRTHESGSLPPVGQVLWYMLGTPALYVGRKEAQMGEIRGMGEGGPTKRRIDLS